MPFELAAFEQEIRKDNLQYERIKQSSLHDLVEAYRVGFPQPTPANLNTLMRAIPREKWRKYKHAKKYLLQQTPAVAPLVRDHLGTIANFSLADIRATANGQIEHTLRWASTTGNLEDLYHLNTRERVTWGIAAPQTQPFLVPEYRNPGQHNGHPLGTPGDIGTATDSHQPVGPFSVPGSMNYQGQATHVQVLNQTYEYTDDSGANWHTIPNSGSTIRREMSTLNGRPLFTITKASVAVPFSRCQNSTQLL